MRKNNKFTEWEIVCIIMLAVGMIIRFLYAYKVPYNISPHDLGQVSNWNESTYDHLGYI